MSVMVCIPSAGKICPETAEAVYAICSGDPGADFRTFRAHPIDRCRTLCARAFVQSPHDHLLFVDSDVVPPADCLDLMLACGHPFVCGIAPIELADGLTSSVARKMGPETYGFYRDFPGEPFEIDSSGLSCCLIAREVFEAIERPWFRFRVRPDGHQTGEDVFFCERAAAAGYRPLAHPGVLCSHRRRVDLRSIRGQLQTASSAG